MFKSSLGEKQDSEHNRLTVERGPSMRRTNFLAGAGKNKPDPLSICCIMHCGKTVQNRHITCIKVVLLSPVDVKWDHICTVFS